MNLLAVVFVGVVWSCCIVLSTCNGIMMSMESRLRGCTIDNYYVG